MKARLYLSTLLVMFTTLATLSAAEKQKLSGTSDYPFWTSKKRGYVGEFVPGLNAALQLTDPQKAQISAARDEMSKNDAIKAARSVSKGDPSVTAEQRDKARATAEAATTQLHEKVAAILTPEQKALIEKVNAAYAGAVEDAGVIYADKFASTKSEELRKRIQEEKNRDIEEQFLQRLEGLLTPSQKEAMKHAAEQEEQRAANAPAKKSGK